MFPSNPTTSSAEDECKPTVITATDEDEPDGVETILFENDEEEDNKSAIPVMEEDVKEADTALNAAALLADAGEEPSDPISITVAESTSSTAPQPLPITLVGDVKAPVLQATPVTIPATPVTISANTNQPVILIPVTNFPTPTLKQLVPIQIQQPVCITVAADAVPHLFRLASAPKQPSAFDALVHDPWIPEPPPGPRFPGRRQVSKLGLRPVMSYEIPGSNQSYVFSLERANVAYDLFECVQCKRNGKRTTIKASFFF
ncbi:hypothetical protein Y032_0574g180 [Ancylostoma ceylanicum]|uniref:Uncharacterized protein n=1 Tax=Ancylostoma ceylanicum TaxID=53326 RepID=A0A016WN86_9BILA|nr:hypothetical protein Y032_0574g180 [Ancylostoma ceylanicum]